VSEIRFPAGGGGKCTKFTELGRGLAMNVRNVAVEFDPWRSGAAFQTVMLPDTSPPNWTRSRHRRAGPGARPGGPADPAPSRRPRAVAERVPECRRVDGDKR